MRHLIIGAGNLGLDLQLALQKAGHIAFTVSRTNGFNYPLDDVKSLLLNDPDYIWVAAGAGSVEQVKKNIVPSVDLNVRLIAELIDAVPEHIRIVTFSSDYAAEPDGTDAICSNPQSIYALTKCWQEELIKMSGRKNIKAVRVSNLYGSYYPLNTFPGKLMAKYEAGVREFCLPTNECCPTSTRQLSEKIVENLDALFAFPGEVLQLAPAGVTTYEKWGRLILPEDVTITTTEDLERPFLSRLGSFTLWENWETLWRQR